MVRREAMASSSSAYRSDSGVSGFLRRLDRRQASEKQDIRAARMRLQQRAQVSQRLDEPAGPDQCPRR